MNYMFLFLLVIFVLVLPVSAMNFGIMDVEMVTVSGSYSQPYYNERYHPSEYTVYYNGEYYHLNEQEYQQFAEKIQQEQYEQQQEMIKKINAQNAEIAKRYNEFLSKHFGWLVNKFWEMLLITGIFILLIIRRYG
jgi:biopolymer transport protein ExbD